MSDSLYRSDHISSVDPNEFISIYELAMRAGHGLIDSPDPTNFRAALVDDDGDLETIGLTDIPLNRAAVAIRQEYGADPTMYRDIMVRFMALIAFLAEPEAQAWREQDPDDDELEWLNGAVIQAAATCPVNSELLFDKDIFVSLARKIAAESDDDD